ncbi:unnamed protein product [Pleuronectes platessa]|uniref:Uncharacterized protein n=1 Tax=Pleuronectes platessa TaxID=8262 RepID=A0A9N7TVD0_PLEPL|nr:unnamed protein product [Pleuronectes platessa]
MELPTGNLPANWRSLPPIESGYLVAKLRQDQTQARDREESRSESLPRRGAKIDHLPNDLRALPVNPGGGRANPSPHLTLNGLSSLLISTTAPLLRPALTNLCHNPLFIYQANHRPSGTVPEPWHQEYFSVLCACALFRAPPYPDSLPIQTEVVVEGKPLSKWVYRFHSPTQQRREMTIGIFLFFIIVLDTLMPKKDDLHESLCKDRVNTENNSISTKSNPPHNWSVGGLYLSALLLQQTAKLQANKPHYHHRHQQQIPLQQLSAVHITT